MSDLTIYAESLISTIARAFYDDEMILVIDILIRDKFLRDDDMSPRLNIPSKKLRSILQYLYDEHIVRYETVDDLNQGGSQATKFYYIDYNRAVHSIRLRFYLLKQQLQHNEIMARSQSYYICPGYKSKRCNGKYNEIEATSHQHLVDYNTGLFLCYECYHMYHNDPNAPSTSSYTLTLVDNTKELKNAMDQLRRFNIQLSSKLIGNIQLRPSIYDLLQKVRNTKGNTNTTTNNNNANGKSAEQQQSQQSQQRQFHQQPITSNLPSENFALGIGSKRLAGTGRTAGIKEKKLLQQGVIDNHNNPDGSPNKNSNNNMEANRIVSSSSILRQPDEIYYLKNAMGYEIQFTIERGGAARAQLLVQPFHHKNNKLNSNKKKNHPLLLRRKRKLMDAAASRTFISSSLPIHIRVMMSQQQQQQAAKLKQLALSKKSGGNKDPKQLLKNKKSQLLQLGDTFEFLKDNIGRNKEIEEEEYKKHIEELEMKKKNGNSNNIDDEDEDEEDITTMNNNNIIVATTKEEEITLLLFPHDNDYNEIQKLTDDKRLSLFQLAYQKEMERQDLISSNSNNNTMMNATRTTISSPSTNGITINNKTTTGTTNASSTAVTQDDDDDEVMEELNHNHHHYNIEDDDDDTSSFDVTIGPLRWEDGDIDCYSTTTSYCSS